MRPVVHRTHAGAEFHYSLSKKFIGYIVGKAMA